MRRARPTALGCDFCYRQAVGMVLSGRRWFKPWQRERWFAVCPTHLEHKQWRHG